MCVYLYIHNKYTKYTHINYINKTFILDAINHLTTLMRILLKTNKNDKSTKLFCDKPGKVFFSSNIVTPCFHF